MAARGKLIVYFGYAPGVGKTYRMLGDALRLRDQGADIVVGYFEPHARPDTIRLAGQLPAIPLRTVFYRGTTLPEMDTDAILARRPALCVVDELAHTNAPGSVRAKRWQDVECLRDLGVDVLTTLNVQHLESLNDEVVQFSGVRVRETVPDWVVAHASEVVMVDLTPRALMHRLERGVVYPPEQAERALTRFFREPTLGALRELALRQAALAAAGRQPAVVPTTAERILVHLTADPATAMLLRRGRRLADANCGQCLAVFIGEPGCEPPPAGRDAIERHFQFARSLRIDTTMTTGRDLTQVLVNFACAEHVTQILLPRGPLAVAVVRLARNLQVTVVAPRRA